MGEPGMPGSQFGGASEARFGADAGVPEVPEGLDAEGREKWGKNEGREALDKKIDLVASLCEPAAQVLRNFISSGAATISALGQWMRDFNATKFVTYEIPQGNPEPKVVITGEDIPALKSADAELRVWEGGRAAFVDTRKSTPEKEVLFGQEK